jgi:hypothetical protein
LRRRVEFTLVHISLDGGVATTAGVQRGASFVLLRLFGFRAGIRFATTTRVWWSAIVAALILFASTSRVWRGALIISVASL